MTTVKAVIFDLDDTLYDYGELNKKAGKAVEDFTCKELGISGERYQEAYQFGREETKKRLSDVGAGHNRLLYFQKTLEYLDVMPMPLSLRMYEEYWGIFLQEMKVFAGVKELFEYLWHKQVPIMICTDLTAHIQHRKIEALGIAPYIRYLVSSEEAGKEKPAKEIFSLCSEKLKLPPEDILYIGDHLEKDIKGASSAGMRTIWFHPGEKTGTCVEACDYGEVRMAIENMIRIEDLEQ
ncbi:MAG: HAD family hydrolase [Lachnospiraceae bacterium]|nr:HAD family hydrolase [Lachnospiraceae bacterium]